MRIVDLGVTPYRHAHQVQEQLVSEVRTGRYPLSLVLCSHTPVITCGRKGVRENVRAASGELEQAGIEIVAAERGGDLTYHGPGQLTAYPVCDLSCFRKDVHWYLRTLEDVVLALLDGFGIQAHRRAGLTGVWINEEKIASIGIGIRHWVTWHGVSLIVHENDLFAFSYIRPCGMDIRMTSMETVLRRQVDMQAVKKMFIERFRKAFQPGYTEAGE